MNIVFQKDGRSGIVYAYENRRIWSEERQKYVNQRKLIGRVANMETKEIVPTDGRCRKRSPYLTDEEKANLHPRKAPEFGPALSKPDSMHNSTVQDSSNTPKCDELADNQSSRDEMRQLIAAVEGINEKLSIIVSQLVN